MDVYKDSASTYSDVSQILNEIQKRLLHFSAVQLKSEEFKLNISYLKENLESMLIK